MTALLKEDSPARAVFKAPAVVAGLDDIAVMREPVEESRRHLRIGEHARPFCEGEVGRDDDRRALVKSADEVEQKLSVRLRIQV